MNTDNETINNCDSSKPNVEEISEFLQIVKRLSDFEAQQRHIRGYGIFKESDELPNKSTMKVLNWLREMV
jgi:hypothetical protein